MYSLRSKHIEDIIIDRNVTFVNFSINWIGYKLRDLNFNLASLSVPHSHLVSRFHKKCVKVLNSFKDKRSVSVLGQHSTKSLYNFIVFCVAFFSKQWLVYAARTNTMFAREIIYSPYFYLQKRNHVGSINEFSSNTYLSLIDRMTKNKK